MIKNFNFYDVYGYFLPGLVLLTLVWLPFGVNGLHWPAKELASALIAVPLAYVVGHILQTIAALSLSARVKKENEKARYPSDLLLDEDDRTFSTEFKDQLANQIGELFKLNVKDGDTDHISRKRQDAFLLCRSTLIASKAASYGEQFEGMYTLMRGLAGAFTFGSLYHIGWGLGDSATAGCHGCQKSSLALGAIALVFALMSASKSVKFRKFKTVWWTVGSLSVGITSVGMYLGSKINTHKPGLLFIIALAAGFASLKCYGSFKFFAWEFAKAIYRDFYNYREIKYKEERSRESGFGTPDDEID